MTIGASWPWNLSTVPDAGDAERSQGAAKGADLGVVGRDDEDVGRLERSRAAVVVGPACAREKMPDDALDGVDFFVGAGLVAFVRDFDEEEAGAGEGGVPVEALALERVDGAEAPLVIELGSEGADRGMEAPGAVEEQALVVGQGRAVLPEHVHQGGDVCAATPKVFPALLKLMR